MSDDLRGADPLRELGKQLPYDRPDGARRDAVRSSLLVAASEGRPPGARARWLLVGAGFAAGALAAAAVAILVMRASGADSATGSRAHEVVATIESSSAAELDRSIVPTPTGIDELVRVRSGKVRLAVPSLRAGDHVRLQTGDAEVEGSGAYEVVVAADALASVTVARGTATIRVNGQQAVFLAAGEMWRAPVITAQLDIAPAPDNTAPPTTATGTTATTTAPAPAPTAAAPPPPTAPVTIAPTTSTRTTTSPTSTRALATSTTAPTAARTTVTAPIKSEPAATEPQPEVTAPRASITAIAEPTVPAFAGSSPTEQAFRAGYSLLRASKYAAAAVELGQAADGDGPLAADARYFQAVALTKAGRGADAERALVQFIDRAPTSVRRGRSMIMLARLLAARGDATSARAWFSSALRDADPSVVAAARTGLDALE